VAPYWQMKIRHRRPRVGAYETSANEVKRLKAGRRRRSVAQAVKAQRVELVQRSCGAQAREHAGGTSAHKRYGAARWSTRSRCASAAAKWWSARSNGAGKTTTSTCWWDAQADAGRIALDGEDISYLPLYQRARRGIKLSAPETSVFRKLTVEQNLLAVLETLPLTEEERQGGCNRC